MPFVSVIVPLYNVEAYVSDCIASLKQQSFADFQAVCVNDGSTDATVRIAKEEVGEDERFVFVDRENGGLSAARNTGLDHATGDYVCFLDSDDWFTPDALERIHTFVQMGDLDVLDYSAANQVEGNTTGVQLWEPYADRTPIPGIATGRELFQRYWELRQYHSPAWLHAVRRSYLDEIGLRFGEGLLHEDELFTPLLYAHAKRAAFLPEPLYQRRVRADSIMTSKHTMRQVESLWHISQQLSAWIGEHAQEFDTAYIDAFARDIAYVRDAAYLYLSNIDTAEVQAYLDNLSIEERIAFNIDIRYVGDRSDERYRDIAESHAFKVGDMLMGIPRAARNVRKKIR